MRASPQDAACRLLRAVIVAGGFLGAIGGGGAWASVTYEYDTVGRIKTALYDDNSCIVYSYDLTGNLVSQTNYLPPQATLPIWGSVTWGNYTWSSSAQNAVWGSGIWGCASWSP